MIASSLEVQNNFDEYLGLSSDQEIVITKDGEPIACLLGAKAPLSFLAERLVGLVPPDVDEDRLKAERLSRQ
jgi:antitoxin (DNA-binding transcriptional repressor) of toxin-antitoxin stability system